MEYLRLDELEGDKIYIDRISGSKVFIPGVYWAGKEAIINGRHIPRYTNDSDFYAIGIFYNSVSGRNEEMTIRERQLFV